MSKRNLRQLLRYWQRRLQLRDWRLEVEVCRYRDGEHLGKAEFDLAEKAALIKICRQQDLVDDPISTESDQESTLIHELLHVVLAPLQMEWEEGDARWLAQEQICNQLARALKEGREGGRQ